MKQQQQQQPSQHNMGAPLQQQGANVNDLFKQQDPVAMLQGNFSDLALKDPQMVCTCSNWLDRPLFDHIGQQISSLLYVQF